MAYPFSSRTNQNTRLYESGAPQEEVPAETPITVMGESETMGSVRLETNQHRGEMHRAHYYAESAPGASPARGGGGSVRSGGGARRSGLANYFLFGQRDGFWGTNSVTMRSEPARNYPLLNPFLQYVGAALGVVSQPLIAQMLKNLSNQPLNLDYLTTLRIWGSLAVGLVIFPGAYRPLAGNTPRLVQFAILFGAGVGWQAIVQSMQK